MTTVGFIGLGSQGGPMARRIIDAGYSTTLWARRPASLEPFADTAARVAGSPAETELVGRLFSELLELQRKGAELSPDAVERTVAMLKGGNGEPGTRPAEVCGCLSSPASSRSLITLRTVAGERSMP